MNLSAEVSKYIKHKVNVANHSSHYLNGSVMNALRECHMLLQLLCRQQQYLTNQDVARFVLQNKNNLFNILPSKGNKSWESSLKNYNAIILQSETLLKPKTL